VWKYHACSNQREGNWRPHTIGYWAKCVQCVFFGQNELNIIEHWNRSVRDFKRVMQHTLRNQLVLPIAIDLTLAKSRCAVAGARGPWATHSPRSAPLGTNSPRRIHRDIWGIPLKYSLNCLYFVYTLCEIYGNAWKWLEMHQCILI